MAPEHDDPDPAREALGSSPPAPRRRGRRVAGIALGALGYAAIAVLAARTVDTTRLTEALARLRGGHIAVVAALLAAHVGGRAARFDVLMRQAGAQGYRLRDGARIFLVGLAASAVTPARAGDLVKAQLVRAHSLTAGAGVGLVVIERLFDLLVLALFLVGTGATLAGTPYGEGLRVSALALLFGLVAVVAVLTMAPLRRRTLAVALGLAARVGLGPLTRRLDAGLVPVFAVWDAVFASPAPFVRVLAISVVAWAFDFAKLAFLLAALGAPAPVNVVFFVYPVSLLVGVLSLLPFAEGVVGVTSVAMLSALARIDPEPASVAVFTDRTLSTLGPVAVAGVAALASLRGRGR